MSITGLSGTASSGADFNFSNLTRKQAITAGGELFNEGKLTSQEVGYLQGFSVDSAPVTPGASSGPDYGLNSSETRNYQSLIQQDLADNLSLGSSQQKEVASDKDLLSVLAPYFSPSASSAITQQSTLDLQA
jgi:hypothetical protein